MEDRSHIKGLVSSTENLSLRSGRVWVEVEKENLC